MSPSGFYRRSRHQPAADQRPAALARVLYVSLDTEVIRKPEHGVSGLEWLMLDFAALTYDRVLHPATPNLLALLETAEEPACGAPTYEESRIIRDAVDELFRSVQYGAGVPFWQTLSRAKIGTADLLQDVDIILDHAVQTLQRIPYLGEHRITDRGQYEVGVTHVVAVPYLEPCLH